MDAVTVLLVEKNTVLSASLTRFLQECYPNEVMIVGTTAAIEEALGQAETRKPQLILLGLDLPGLPSLRLIPRLRNVLPDVRVIALTLFDTDGYRESAIAAGADDLISKARLATDLLPAIRRVMKIAPPPDSGRTVGTDTLTIQ